MGDNINIKKSLTYLDRSSGNKNYMFMSYSHKNSEFLMPIFQKLYENDANFWYDTEMHTGDNWKEVAEKALCENARCLGAVFFCSAEYLISSSCKDEIKWFIEENKRRKEDGLTELKSCVVIFEYGDGNIIENLKKKARSIAENLSGKEYDDADDNISELMKLIKELTQNYAKLHAKLSEVGSNKDNIDNILDFFNNNSCSVKVNEILEQLYKKGEFGVIKNVDQNEAYYTKQIGIIYEGKDPLSNENDWAIYNYDGEYFYMIPRHCSIGTCCMSLADDKLRILQSLSLDEKCSEGKKIILSDNPKNEISLTVSETDVQIKEIRFLKKSERIEYADTITWAVSGDYDQKADGYFFVSDDSCSGDAESHKNVYKCYFADRKSSDVYDSVWVDEIASVIPVIVMKP